MSMLAYDYYICYYYRCHLQDYIEVIMSRIQDLLTLNSPDNGVKTYLSPDDQLFIYESASILVVHSLFPPEVTIYKHQELYIQKIIIYNNII